MKRAVSPMLHEVSLFYTFCSTFPGKPTVLSLKTSLVALELLKTIILNSKNTPPIHCTEVYTTVW